jgi:hypothetical protein
MTSYRAVLREEKKLRWSFSVSSSSSWEGGRVGQDFETSLTVGGGTESVNTSDKVERHTTDWSQENGFNVIHRKEWLSDLQNWMTEFGTIINIVWYLLKAIIVEAETQQFLGSACTWPKRKSHDTWLLQPLLWSNSCWVTPRSNRRDWVQCSWVLSCGELINRQRKM